MNQAELQAQAVDIFLGAATYIRKYGWQVSGMSSHGLPRCSMGALASAHQDRVWDEELSELMYRQLNDELDGIGLTEFNYRHKDGEKVVQLFEKVAANLSKVHARPVHS